MAKPIAGVSKSLRKMYVVCQSAKKRYKALKSTMESTLLCTFVMKIQSFVVFKDYIVTGCIKF